VSKSQVQVSYDDWRGKRGTFGFLMDAAFNAAPYTELIAALNALRAASQCTITQVMIADVFDISVLTNPAAGGATSDATINEQAVLAFRSTSGSDVKVSLPGPLDTIFVATGGYAGQDVDELDALVVALVDALEVIGVDRGEAQYSYRKGWRRGHPHS